MVFKKGKKNISSKNSKQWGFPVLYMDYIKHYISNYYFVFVSQYVSKDGIHQS